MLYLIAIFLCTTTVLFLAGQRLLKAATMQSAIRDRFREVGIHVVPAPVAMGQIGGDSATGISDRIENLLGKQLGHRAQLLLLQGNSEMPVRTFYLSSLIGFLAVFLLLNWLTSMLPLTLGMAFLAGCLPTLWLVRRRQKRITAFNLLLPECIETCSRSLRAGHSIVSALGIVAEHMPDPAKTEFSEVFKKQSYGLPLREALLQMLDRVPSDDLRIVVTGILVQGDTGGNLPEIFDRIVEVMRNRLRIQSEIRIHTAQGRLTGWILCLLPLLLLVVINVINPGYSRILFEDPRGRMLLTTGVFLLITGWLLIHLIINGIEV